MANPAWFEIIGTILLMLAVKWTAIGLVWGGWALLLYLDALLH